MNRTTLVIMLMVATCAGAQTTGKTASAAAAAPASAAPGPLPAAAPLLDGLEQAAKAASATLMELRIDKWKGSSAEKERYQENSQALQRNMVYALPEIINEVRRAPEDLSSNFKLYRNLDALHDVLANLTAAAAEDGRGDDYRNLAEHTSALDAIRRSLAERFEVLTEQKDQALAGVRKGTVSKSDKPAPKKIIVDDTQPARRKKK